MAGLLGDYRAKRDFKKTAEPSGDRRIRSAQYPRFVIQKHDATRIHYDLRLEIDGVFKSWAVTRGPSLDPTQKRLAVEVEDHPLDYGDFEGTIPEGQYGGGTVMLWDRGFWSPIGDTSPDEALRDGELKFTIGGTKLKGSWVLVRMKRDRTGGQRVNWLLIKHRDAWARPGDDDKLLKKDRSVASARTMGQIASGKGAGPSPFMLAKHGLARPDAVWNSAVETLAAGSTRTTERRTASKRKPRAPTPRNVAEVRAKGSTILGVTISKPDKVLWPGGDARQITKLQLAEYLATVGPWMIAHLQGRPCWLLRAPDGIKGETFFQRHASKGMTDLIETVKVKGDHEPYIQIDETKALVAMGQIAVLEFHPWNCEPFEPEIPGRLVFDLDPAPDVAFGRVIEAAKELKDRLSAVGLVAFCKTTGGKGLHVVTPLKPRSDDRLGWSEAKAFAHTVSLQMAEDSPLHYLTKMTKKLRTGKIFLDYLRNDRTATAVAPLSPRARLGATVSMPLTWEQVRSDLDPKRFTILTAPALLNKSSAWSDYAAGARSLKTAIKKLVGTR